LIEHCAENVFRLNLLILTTLGEFNPRLNGFLSSESEFV
jgi:hypothetical protein